MTFASTITPGLEIQPAADDTDTGALVQEKPQGDAFPYAWYGGWAGSEKEPLVSWAHLGWLCTSILGSSPEMPHIVIVRTDAPERAAQVFGNSGACIAEVQASWRMQRVRRPGAKGMRRTLIGSDGFAERVFASEIFDSQEAASIARHWLEAGALDGLGRHHIWY